MIENGRHRLSVGTALGREDGIAVRLFRFFEGAVAFRTGEDEPRPVKRDFARRSASARNGAQNQFGGVRGPEPGSSVDRGHGDFDRVRSGTEHDPRDLADEGHVGIVADVDGLSVHENRGDAVDRAEAEFEPLRAREHGFVQFESAEPSG